MRAGSQPLTDLDVNIKCAGSRFKGPRQSVKRRDRFGACSCEHGTRHQLDDWIPKLPIRLQFAVNSSVDVVVRESCPFAILDALYDAFLRKVQLVIAAIRS